MQGHGLVNGHLPNVITVRMVCIPNSLLMDVFTLVILAILMY